MWHTCKKHPVVCFLKWNKLQGHFSFVVSACRGTHPNAELPVSFEAPFFFFALRHFLLAAVHRYVFMGQDWGCLRYETQYEGRYCSEGCSYMSGMQDEHMEHQQTSVPSAPALPRGHSLWLIAEPACCWLDCCSAAGFVCREYGVWLLLPVW